MHFSFAAMQHIFHYEIIVAIRAENLKYISRAILAMVPERARRRACVEGYGDQPDSRRMVEASWGVAGRYNFNDDPKINGRSRLAHR